MKKINFVLITTFVLGNLFFKNTLKAQAFYQYQFMNNMDRHAVKKVTYENANGSPYIPEDFTNGSIQVSTTQKFEDLRLKFDAYAGKIAFEYKDETLEIPVPYAHVSIGNMIFENGFPDIDGNEMRTYYQVLSSGKMNFLKHYRSLVKESSEFGKGMVRRFVMYENYYLAQKNGGIVKIAINKEDILKILAEKSTEIEGFITKNKLKIKKPEDVIKVVEFYNSL